MNGTTIIAPTISAMPRFREEKRSGAMLPAFQGCGDILA